MLVLAISAKGQEFFYKASSCHAVSKASAERIRNALNESGYNLNEGQAWHIHEVDYYDTASDYASFQAFKVRKGRIYETR